jgi:hypothetical protein
MVMHSIFNEEPVLAFNMGPAVALRSVLPPEEFPDLQRCHYIDSTGRAAEMERTFTSMSFLTDSICIHFLHL